MRGSGCERSGSIGIVVGTSMLTMELVEFFVDFGLNEAEASVYDCHWRLGGSKYLLCSPVVTVSPVVS